VLFSIGLSSQIFAQHTHNHSNASVTKIQKPIHRVISDEHSKELSSLLVQDFKGRIIPFQTMCNELMLKVYGKKKFEDKNAVQTILSMHMYPDYWLTKRIIAVPKAVREQLHLGEYASFKELIDNTGELKCIAQYNAAHKKLDSKKSEFDKKLIKLVERHQVLQSIFSWQYMKLIPVQKDEKDNWYVPLSMDLMQKDSVSSSLALQYLSAVDEGCKKNSFTLASEKLTNLKRFQRIVGARVVPSETHVKWEIRYNNMEIFKNSMYTYFSLGLLLLIVFFVRIFISPTERSEKRFKRISIPIVALLVLIFVYHGAGLGMRWYISGHAPWSNGYEAVIFIAWVTMIAGFIFSRNNPVVLAGTAILAFFMIFVTEMNLLDPEITPLQPVLKSYWLMIHVAIITGSYGFLGLGAILGFFNQLLYIFRSKLNAKRITAHINEITYISEMTMTIGLFMLTIGTFLGGIWANESWGRYWGWDPKETWALVSVLVYAVILHLRYIPALNSKFTFNVVSFWGYTSILFTFFGVNFYLTGLHSYASGEGLAKVPEWIFWTFYGFYVFTEIAALRYQLFKSESGIIPWSHFMRKAKIVAIILVVVCALQLLFITQAFDLGVIALYGQLAGLFAITLLILAFTTRKK
jgi:cytochrome c-type biogenesis protein CcsB